MRRPIVAFAAGIVCLQLQPELPPWGAAALSAVIFALAALAWRAGRPWLVLPAAFLIGFAYAAWRAEARLADRLAAEWEGRDVVVVGAVADMPQEFGQGSRFEFDVESVDTAGAVLPSRIALSWYRGMRDDELHEARPVRAGERWRLTVRLKRPHGNANLQGFDYEAWLFERGIRATGYVRPKTEASRLAAMVWHPGYGIERMRQAVRDSFEEMLPAANHPYAGILVALAVGDQRAIAVES